jgi:hypothetical protein
MQIYLTPPGGEREGPFTLEQINRDLAARKYKETDYWAWYSGLKEWVPLHVIPGIVGSDDTLAWVLDDDGRAAAAKPSPVKPASLAVQPSTQLATPAAEALATQHHRAKTAPEHLASEPAAPATELPPEPQAEPGALERKLLSGLAATALDQVFILTTGEGPTASRSPTTIKVLEQTVGEPIAAIRERATRDVVSHCTFIEQLRTQGAVPAAAWTAMANFKTQLVQDARTGRYKVVVRTFPTESGDLVCLFLFYNRAKL